MSIKRFRFFGNLVRHDIFLNAFNTKTKDQWGNRAEKIGIETGDKILKEAGAIK